jgi:hypothetical protein
VRPSQLTKQLIIRRAKPVANHVAGVVSVIAYAIVLIAGAITFIDLLVAVIASAIVLIAGAIRPIYALRRHDVQPRRVKVISSA